MIDSKVVPFEQGAEFLHARGMKHKRSGNWLDALDLLRRAQQAAPEGADYRLDMAEVYAGMDCHRDSRAMALMHIFSREKAPDAYFHLAKCAAEMGALPEAEKAYGMYLSLEPKGDRAEEAQEELADIRTAYGMWRKLDRGTRRRVRRLRQVRRLQMEHNYAAADMLYAREAKSAPGDVQVAVNRAMNLCLMGDMDAARRELEAVRHKLREYPSGIIILAAQVYYRLGDIAQADGALGLLQRGEMTAQDWQMLMALHADMGRNEQAYAAGSEALKQRPYDRRMLHLMAVTAARLGRSRDVIAGYWQKILRIAPDDDVAQYYLNCLQQGELTAEMLFDSYALPPLERIDRSKLLLEMMEMSIQQLEEAWNDKNVRRVLHWALFSETPALVAPAIRLLSTIDAQESIAWLAEFLSRAHADMELRLAAAQAIRESRWQAWPGVDGYLRMQMIPGSQEALDALPVPYRQTARMASEYLEREFGLNVAAAPALQCAEYLQQCEGKFNRMLDLRCGAAALAAIELRAAGRNANVKELARLFDCSARKLKYYLEYLGSMPGEGE